MACEEIQPEPVGHVGIYYSVSLSSDLQLLLDLANCLVLMWERLS